MSLADLWPSPLSDGKSTTTTITTYKHVVFWKLNYFLEMTQIHTAARDPPTVAYINLIHRQLKKITPSVIFKMYVYNIIIVSSKTEMCVSGGKNDAST